MLGDGFAEAVSVALDAARWTGGLVDPTMSIPRARQSCFASWPITRPTRRLGHSNVAIFRSLGGRAADGAVW